LAVSASISDDGAGSADQIVRVVWTWSGYLAGSLEQSQPYQGQQWMSPSIGNIPYTGDPNGGGSFTVTATAYDRDGQSATLTSGAVTVTACRLPWIDWSSSPGGVRLTQMISSDFPCDENPRSVDAIVSGRNGVVRLVVAWSGFISGQRDAKVGEIITFGPVRYSGQPNDGGQVRVTVVGYDAQGQKSNELATIFSVAGCTYQPPR
jgi:hypothetical protein